MFAHSMLTFVDRRSILHLDADAFFASVEQRDEPKLRGKPVAVGTGVVASCSYEARRFGVTTGMALAEARRRCRPLIVVPGEYPRYEQTARRMLAICQERTPHVEAAALDDLYLDLAAEHLDQCQPLAERLREQVWEETQLQVSIGVGSNKLIAKVATKDAKQRKLRAAQRETVTGKLHSLSVLVAAGTEREYLAPWPVRVLPGAGRQLGDKLEQLNVQRVGEVAAMPLPVLRGLFRQRGRVLHEQAQGIDPRPVEPHRPRQSVSRCTSFEPAVADRAFLRAMLDYLLERATSWLRFNNLAAKGLTVTLRYGDYESAAGRDTLRQATACDEVLKEAARARFETLYQRRLPLRLLGIELAPLAPLEGPQSLFTDPEEERARRLAQCKDAVRQRFGFTSLLSGSAMLLADRLERDRENFRMRTPCLTR